MPKWPAVGLNLAGARANNGKSNNFQNVVLIKVKAMTNETVESHCSMSFDHFSPFPQDSSASINQYLIEKAIGRRNETCHVAHKRSFIGGFKDFDCALIILDHMGHRRGGVINFYIFKIAFRGNSRVTRRMLELSCIFVGWIPLTRMGAKKSAVSCFVQLSSSLSS